MMKIILLVSGGLGHQVLNFLIDHKYDLSAVLTDKSSDKIIDLCASKHIKIFVGNPRSGKTKNFISNLECDVLLSVNYLFIIEKDLISLPRLYAVNIHGSLLPKYRGRTPHVWAIINGETQTGITAHLINEKVDNGAILKQVIVPIEKNNTGAEIVIKFNDLYPSICFDVLNSIESNTVELKTQDRNVTTYFGKRTPSDGQINWEWSKERIRNWIRAQANPYPGAFTFLDNNKIVINSSCFDDTGYHYENQNGQVLKVLEDSIIVKTCNGALKLTQLVFNAAVLIKKGEILK